MKNERTSKRVAAIAAKVLAIKKAPFGGEGYVPLTSQLWRDIRALAASALTQAPDNSQVAKAMRGELGTKKRKVPR